MLLNFLFLATDHEEALDPYDLQLQCIKNFCVEPRYGSQEFIEGFHIRNNVSQPRVCEYTGFRCLNYVLKTLSFYNGNDYGNAFVNAKLDLYWLPSTLHAVYIKRNFLATQCLTSTLPRDLRFLFLDSVESLRYDCRFHVDLPALPVHMEELHLLYVLTVGPLVFNDLPKSLRRVQILASITRVFIGEVPENFEIARIVPPLSRIKKPSIKMMNEAKNSRFLQTKGEFALQNSNFIRTVGDQVFLQFEDRGYE